VPPPLMKPYLKDRINLIRQQVEASMIKAGARASQTAKTPPSLDALIEDWVRSLTPDQRSRTYGISEIIQLAQLKGRYKEWPAKQMVATALYKLGFTQIRSWKKQSRNRRYWLLP
jgi:hypothetical protein